MAEEALKERLIRNLERLPQDRLLEVLDFIEFLHTREAEKTGRKSPKESEPPKDPILTLIGIADVEPFSHRIDEELYGK